MTKRTKIDYTLSGNAPWGQSSHCTVAITSGVKVTSIDTFCESSALSSCGAWVSVARVRPKGATTEACMLGNELYMFYRILEALQAKEVVTSVQMHLPGRLLARIGMWQQGHATDLILPPATTVSLVAERNIPLEALKATILWGSALDARSYEGSDSYLANLANKIRTIGRETFRTWQVPSRGHPDEHKPRVSEECIAVATAAINADLELRDPALRPLTRPKA